MKYAEIEFGFFDITAKEDGQFDTTDAKSFVQMSQLQDDNITPEYYMSNQWNYTILDGTYEVRDEGEYGFISSEMTDENGDFENNPVITREYENTHSTIGLGFTFSEEGCPKQIKITYYNGSTQLGQYTDTVDALTYYSKHEVDDYNKWTLELIGTKIPFRNAQIVEVHYGVFRTWSNDEIVSANLIEEIDLASNELPIKELTFELKDETGEYDILNPNGLYSTLREGQPLYLREKVDGTTVQMGTFYLTSWESTTGNIAKFTAQDIIGELDKYQFEQTGLWQSVTFTNALGRILEGRDIEYEIDPAVAQETVSGYIETCTMREALQELCFTQRCYCISGRDNKLYIKRLNTSDTAYTIGKSITADMQVNLADIVNQINVYGYVPFTEPPAEVWRKEYNETSNNIFSAEYDEPTTEAELHYITLLGGTIQKLSGSLFGMRIRANVLYNENEDTKIWITGQKITSEERLYIAEEQNANIIYPVEIKELHLINQNNGQSIANHLLNYYAMRISEEFKLLMTDEQIGDRVQITVGDYNRTGRITKLDIDLANGFIATAKVVNEVE